MTPPPCTKTFPDGRIMAWAVEPGQEATPEAALGASHLRSQVLAEGGTRPGGEIPPNCREVTLLNGWRLAPDVLLELLAGLRSAAPGCIVRLEWPLTEAGPGTVGALESLAATLGERMPLFVHLQWFGAVRGLEEIQGCTSALCAAGIPLAGEVYLKGGPPSAESLGEQLRAMMAQGVRPYYLVLGTWLPKAQWVEEETALALVKQLRGWISGTAMPQLVRESPGGERTPLVPEYVQRVDEQEAVGRTFRGESFSYRHLNGEKK